jgi:hypothetical protein
VHRAIIEVGDTTVMIVDTNTWTNAKT